MMNELKFIDPDKKSYRTPRLWVYGDVGSLTAAMGMKGIHSDGNLKGNTKTV